MKYAVIDIETTGLDRYKDMINYVGVGLAESIQEPLKSYNIYEIPYETGHLLRLMGNIRSQKSRTVFQNGKFDTLFMERHLKLKLPIHYDVMLLGTAYDLSVPHGLKDMAQRYLGVENWDVGKKLKLEKSEQVVEYLKLDLRYTWELFQYFHKRMNPDQWKSYHKILRPAYLMYRQAESDGIYLDQESLKITQQRYKKEADAKLQVLNDQHPINWNSPKQVSDLLFNQLNFPTIKLSQKTGSPSADAKVLKRLRAKGFTLAEQLMDYKFYYGANSKFLNAWPKYIRHDGRIHPTFHLTNVVTGRTSCSDPNLQQVPRKPELRGLFTAPPHRALIEVDYSQIELRIAAEYANERNMLKIYHEGGDIHTLTAQSITGLSAAQVKGEYRTRAKAVNFGFLYGMAAKGFVNYAFDSYDTVVSLAEAERYRQLFFHKYPNLLKWHKNMEILCESLGGIANMFGRFRPIPDIYNQDQYLRGKAIRQAINTPVQSTANDLLLLAAVEISKKLRSKYDLKIVGTIHDSILIDLPKEYVEQASKEIREIMIRPEVLEHFDIQLKVPLDVEISVGAWGVK